MSDVTTAAATTETVTASPSARTISGRVVPFGPAGQTSQGRLTFAAGALRWSDPKRVKLLLEHDQRQAVGFATELEERPDGLYATFSVPEHALGDTALLEATHGLRDAFSVGVQLDEASATKLRRAQGTPVPGVGALREVSLVSVPAFDDARVDNVASSSGALVVSAWTTATTPNDPADPGPDDPAREEPPMTDTVEPAAPTAPVIPTQPDTVELSAPAVVTAAAGAALVTGEPATYTFDGNGPSLVRDVYNAKHDPAASERLARLNADLASGTTAQSMALAAVATRTDLNELVNPSIRRPDLLLAAIDLGRPLVSRLPRIAIANAQPFLLPVEGEFTGVGAHTEGTAHVAEGTMTLNEVTVTPRAVSGAYRLSRELVDSSNPAADAIAVRAMLRDYRRVSEALVLTELTTAAGAAVLNVDTLAETRRELIDFANDNNFPADFLAAGGGFYTALANEVDTTGRPMLPYVGPTNAAGTIQAGYTGASIDGVEVVRSSGVAAAEAFIIAGDGVMYAESPVQTFRFDQPEGPGIIKIALFAYQAVRVTRAGSVRRLTTAAA